MRTLLAALVAVFLCSNAYAQECGPGTAPVEYLADYLNRNGVTEYFVVEEPKRSMVVDRINKAQPPTDWNPDKVLVYVKGGGALLVLFIGDCYASPGPMPRGMLEGLRPTGRAS